MSEGTQRRPIPPRSRATTVRPRPQRNLNLIVLVTAGALVAVTAVLALVLRPWQSAPVPPPPPPRTPGPPPRDLSGGDAQPPPRRLPVTPLPPGPPPAAEPDERAEFLARLAEKREAARRSLEEAQRELAERARTEQQDADALRATLAQKPLTLALRSGESYEGAVIRSFSITDVDIEAGGAPRTIPWDSLTAESTLRAAALIFDAGSAQRQFECGRFLIARRLWNEAKGAFARAVKLDDSLDVKIQEVREALDRLTSGEAGFRGSARRVGADKLVLTYDFKDPVQLQDFSGRLAIGEGGAVLESKRRAWAWLRLDFVNEFEIEFKVTASATVWLSLFAGELTGYRIELAPDEVALYRSRPRDDDDGKEIARRTKSGIAADRPHDVHVIARDRRFRVFIDRVEALAAEDPAGPGGDPTLRGSFAIGVQGGRAAFAPGLGVRGTVDPRELDKRFAEIEILVRRAVDPDLKDVEEAREREVVHWALGTAEGLKLTADDKYFTIRHMAKDLVEYDGLKNGLAEYLAMRFGARDVKKKLNELIENHPEVPSLYYLRALLQQRRGDRAAAIEDAKKAIALFPEFTEALTLQARLHDWDYDFDAALASAQRAIDCLPDYAPAYVQHAIAGYGKDPSKAAQWIADLQTALTLQPWNREASMYLRALRYQSRGPRDLGCRFNVETAHYIVTTDISEEATRTYADRLEAAYRHYGEVFKRVYEERPFRKPRVAVFNTAENFYTYTELLSEHRATYALGMFQPRYNELILFEMVDIEETLHTLYHEGFHHFFMELIGPRNPPYWFNEGVAEYMGGIRVQDGKVVETGVLLKGRLRDIQRALEEKASVPFEHIICATPAEFYGWTINLNYAQAWSMVYFFYEYEKGKYRPLIEKYLDELRAGKGLRGAFEAVFKDNWRDLQGEWKDFVKKLKP